MDFVGISTASKIHNNVIYTHKSVLIASSQLIAKSLAIHIMIEFCYYSHIQLYKTISQQKGIELLYVILYAFLTIFFSKELSQNAVYFREQAFKTYMLYLWLTSWDPELHHFSSLLVTK